MSYKGKQRNFILVGFNEILLSVKTQNRPINYIMFMSTCFL